MITDLRENQDKPMWELTRTEFFDAYFAGQIKISIGLINDPHFSVVEWAVQHGKYVPQENLERYNLAGKHST